MTVRVRFAPSPTGGLHIGGARTALFNWLFARHMGGKFILRIEDTDKARSTQLAVHNIIQGLEWLGLDWDEGPHANGTFGPYFQSQRLDLYKKFAQKLLKNNLAYENEKAIKFRVPKNETIKIHDLIHGEIEFKTEVIEDFISLKSDNHPTYNFAAVVDDLTMEITHIIRGDDHISNTSRQYLIYKAINAEMPKVAHIPMIHGKDKQRLSKRHGATSIVEYRDMGILPEALFNYLAHLSWGYGDQEIFSREELIEKFQLENVSKTAAIFDMEKLLWLNGHYIRNTLPERIFDLVMPYLENAYGPLKSYEENKEGMEYLNKIVKCLQDRIKLIPDLVPLSEYFFKEPKKYDEKGVEKYFNKPETKSNLEKLIKKLEKSEEFKQEIIEKNFKELCAELNCKLGTIIHPVRLALTGRLESPGIYNIVELLGKNKTLKRLKSAINSIS